MRALVLGGSFTGGGQSMREIIAAVEQVTGKQARVSYTAARNFDVPISVLDITRAAKMPSWKPKVDLKEGLRLAHARIKGK